MSSVDFDQVPVTTSVLVLPLQGTVDILRAFPLIRITRLDIPNPGRRRQKFKLPYPGYPGAIITAGYEGLTRGIVRSLGYFRNAITIDVSTKIKNINLKLAGSTIHMCGATSSDMALEAANYVVQNLNDVQDTLDYIQADPEISQRTIDWVRDHTRGEKVYVIKDTHTLVKVENVQFRESMGVFVPNSLVIRRNLPGPSTKEDLTCLKYIPIDNCVGFTLAEEDFCYVEEVYSVVVPTEYVSGYPEGINARIATFLIEQAPDFARHDYYTIHLDWVRDLNRIIQRPLSIRKVTYVMVNYNYDLCFKVDRWALHEEIKGIDGFMVRYENVSDHSVTVQLPYEVPEHLEDVIVKRKRKPVHTFLVYESGLVTQSGPYEDLNRDAYNKFNKLLSQLKPNIAKRDNPRPTPPKPVLTMADLVGKVVIREDDGKICMVGTTVPDSGGCRNGIMFENTIQFQGV